jgi:hypothetical protein
MTGFLSRLAAHAQGQIPVLQPRPRSRFEPAGATATLLPTETEVVESESFPEAAADHREDPGFPPDSGPRTAVLDSPGTEASGGASGTEASGGAETEPPPPERRQQDSASTLAVPPAIADALVSRTRYPAGREAPPGRDPAPAGTSVARAAIRAPGRPPPAAAPTASPSSQPAAAQAPPFPTASSQPVAATRLAAEASGESIRPTREQADERADPLSDARPPSSGVSTEATTPPDDETADLPDGPRPTGLPLPRATRSGSGTIGAPLPGPQQGERQPSVTQADAPSPVSWQADREPPRRARRTAGSQRPDAPTGREEPADVPLPSTGDLTRRHIVPALADAGLLTPGAHVEVIDEPAFDYRSGARSATARSGRPRAGEPGEGTAVTGRPNTDLVSISGEPTVRRSEPPSGGPPQIHVTIGRVNVIRAAPPATALPAPPPRRPGPDHQAYLARRREDSP